MTQQNKPSDLGSLSQEDKDILIARMLECPGQLSDSEIELILQDEELRDIYQISVELKAGKKSQMKLDAVKEWELFEPLMDKPEKAHIQKDNSPESNHKKSFAWFNLSSSNIKRITRVAAIFVGAFLVVGAIQVFNNQRQNSHSNTDELIAKNNQIIQTTSEKLPEAQSEYEDPTLPLQSSSKDESQEPKVEEKATPQQESSPASTTHVKTKKKKAQVNMKPNSQIAQFSEDVDIEEHLRVQRARMENDLAMQRAEAVINQYYTMAEMTGEDPNPLITNLNYTVTDMDRNELVALILP